MSTEVKAAVVPKDCLGCRLVSAAGLCGIGAYLANFAWKNKTFAGKLTLSTLSLAFVSLGIARYQQKYPFEMREAKKFETTKVMPPLYVRQGVPPNKG